MLDETVEQHKEEMAHQEYQSVLTIGDTRKQDRQKSLYLGAGQTHMVWKPTHQQTEKNMGVENRQDLVERQHKLQSRIMATQEVLKDHREELAVVNEEDEEESVEVPQPMSKGRNKWQKTIQHVIKDNTKGKKTISKRNVHFHEIVSMYVETMSTPTNNGAAKPIVPGFRQWKSQFKEGNKETDTWKHKSSIPMHAMGEEDQCMKSETTVTSAESKA